MEETIKAVGYARFSSSMQREESITAQKIYDDVCQKKQYGSH